MDYNYSVGVNVERERYTITINRKPSEMKSGIDMELLALSGMCHMNGPDSRMVYEFLLPGNFKFLRAVNFLDRCGWKRNNG